MPELIVLITPLHTGTHFVRLLLECHPAVGTAVGEDYRVPHDPVANAILPGRGKGWFDDSVRPEREAQRGTMLGSYFQRVLSGSQSLEELQQLLEYRGSIYSERSLPLTLREFELRLSQQELSSFGIPLEPKSEKFQFFRCHWQDYYSKDDVERNLHGARIITTIRHPLRSILSVLRREPVVNHDSLLNGYLSSLEKSLSLSDAFVFCTDLWQDSPSRMSESFRFLGIDVTPAVREFTKVRPKVNVTIAPADPHGLYAYCIQHPHDEKYLKELYDAKLAFDQGEVHPICSPYWKRIRESCLSEKLESIGYDIRGFSG